MTNRCRDDNNQTIILPLDEADGSDHRRAFFLSYPSDATAEDWMRLLAVAGRADLMIVEAEREPEEIAAD